jgi:hypothetical protein
MKCETPAGVPPEVVHFRVPLLVLEATITRRRKR